MPFCSAEIDLVSGLLRRDLNFKTIRLRERVLSFDIYKDEDDDT